MLFSEMKCTYLCQFDPPALYKCPIVWIWTWRIQSLATSELQYIEFELRSHTGSLIEFTNEAETYLSLSLKDE